MSAGTTNSLEPITWEEALVLFPGVKKPYKRAHSTKLAFLTRGHKLGITDTGTLIFSASKYCEWHWSPQSSRWILRSDYRYKTASR